MHASQNPSNSPDITFTYLIPSVVCRLQGKKTSLRLRLFMLCDFIIFFLEVKILFNEVIYVNLLFRVVRPR